MKRLVLTTRATAAVLLFAVAEGCDDDGDTGPCSKEERAVARAVVHPKGLKLKFARDYDGMCVADIPEDQAEAAVRHYKQQLPRQGWELREGNKNGGVYSKGNMRFAVWIEPGSESLSYVAVAKDVAP
jgi:hypothetical protein